MKSTPTVNPSGTIVWFAKNGIIHREDGPAIKHSNGYCSWYFNGNFHRINGPAIDHATRKYWFFHGKYIDCNSQEEFERLLRLKAFW